MSIGNLLIFLVLPESRSALLSIFTPVMRASYSIIGSRIMLNMRGALTPGRELGMTDVTTDMNLTDMFFARTRDEPTRREVGMALSEIPKAVSSPEHV